MDQTTTFVVAVAAIIFKKGKVLAMRRSLTKDAGAGLWETLSGRVELDEEPLEAIKREIIEECNLSVRVDPRPITAYQTFRKDKPMILILYRADYISGEVQRSEEHDDHAWLTPDEFAQQSIFQKLVDVVYQAVDLN